MAFQMAALSNIAAMASAEMLPSAAKAAAAAAAAATSQRGLSIAALARQAPPGSIADSRQATVPRFLRATYAAHVTPSLSASSDIVASISNMSYMSLAAQNTFTRRLLTRPLATRSFSTLPSLQLATSQFTRIPAPPSQSRRTFGTGGVSRSLLASREATANRNPESATAQNAFYQLLLSANLPAIIIERYNSGRFARNQACDEAYQRALGMTTTVAAAAAESDSMATSNGSTSSVSGSGTTPLVNSIGNPYGFSHTQLQAVGQAVAAKSRGSNIGVGQPSGAGGPLHVMVDETRGIMLLRWAKFIAWFGLFTYLSLIVVTMVIDQLNMLPKRGGNRGNTETKAENQKARFSDVHGCDEAKEELVDLVEFLKNPEKFNTLGGKLPKGVLLVGPPGTGKTLLARAVAGEAGVPFFYMSGSEFDEVYVGVGAKRVRELFSSAKAKSPAIIFIDELDAIGGRRNSRDAAYVKQTLNQLLTELDGFDQNSGVIILGATNFPELLDKALTRPGRFDRHVVVGLPDARGRIEILKHHTRKIKASKDVDLQAIAVTTVGLSGAELENIVNEAAVHASKKKAKEVTMNDFEWAKDKVIMGAERKTMVINPKEKEMTAYHEAGHALIGYYNNPLRIHKVTILPRGQTLGHVAKRPEMDKYSYTSSEFMQDIECAYGGLVAEELVYGADKTTSGVSSDIENATRLAFMMVTAWGMSKGLGPIEYRHRYNTLSPKTKADIEDEVRRKLNEAYEKTKKMLTEKRPELDALAQALLKYETLDRAELAKVLQGKELTGRVPVPKGGSMVVPKPEIPGEFVPGMGEGGAEGSEGSGQGQQPPMAPPPGTEGKEKQ